MIFLIFALWEYLKLELELLNFCRKLYKLWLKKYMNYFSYFPIVNVKKTVFFSDVILSNAGYTLMSNNICDFKDL